MGGGTGLLLHMVLLLCVIFNFVPVKVLPLYIPTLVISRRSTLDRPWVANISMCSNVIQQASWFAQSLKLVSYLIERWLFGPYPRASTPYLKRWRKLRVLRPHAKVRVATKPFSKTQRIVGSLASLRGKRVTRASSPALTARLWGLCACSL